MANNVILIDPNNDVDINPNITNGIPQYQDMYIFAELTARRKGRTVLVGSGESNKLSVEKTGLEDTTTVNFIGNNQDINNPNYLKFTTNYYDNNNESVQYEGFGINSIKIVINSSFVPQINVQFVDIRGNAFFNRENSPYRILFDFPPPNFDLTIKGYYGKALTYKLHLVKYTSEFKAENGNYIIDAQFVAITFAPLTDILLRYVINFPLINNPKSMASTTNVKPESTYELITKLRNLYSAVSEEMKTMNETQLYDNTLIEIRKNNEAFAVLANYKNDIEQDGKPFAIVVDTSPEYSLLKVRSIKDADITRLENDNVLNYTPIIKEYSTSTTPTQINKRVYIAYYSSTPVAPYVSIGDNKIDELKKTLGNLKSKLLKKVEGLDSSIKSTDISDATILDTSYGRYVGIDITNYYWILYKKSVNLNKSKKETSTTINTKINNMIVSELGMKPTIYNIFQIILNDVDKFFNILKETVISAEEEHHPKFKSQIIGDQYVENNDKIYAFPLIVNRHGVLCGGYREERIAPIELSKSLGDNAFPEIKLVNDFIDTFFQQKKITELLNLKGAVNADGSYKWIPISPFDSSLSSSDVSSPYINMDNSNSFNSSDKDKFSQALEIFVKRFYVLSQSSIPTNFYGKNSANYCDLFGESEAINLAISMQNPLLINVLKENANKYSKNIELFYSDLEKYLPLYYNFEGKEVINISGKADAYVNKSNTNYTGVKIFNGEIGIQDLTNNTNTPIGKFFTDSKKTNWFKKIFGATSSESFYEFSDTNLIYINDKNPDGKNNTFTDTNLDSRFLGTISLIQSLPTSVNFSGMDKKSIINNLLNVGNSGFGYVVGTSINNEFSNIVDVWVDQLSSYDTALLNGVFKTKSKLGALICLSNFGFTLSPFNGLNANMFNVPAVINVPTYLPPYLGSLVSAIEGTDTSFTVQIIKDFFTGSSGNMLDSAGLSIFADIHDVDKHLSKNDKELFKIEFNNFYDNYYDSILERIQNLYNNVKASTNKSESYDHYLNPVAKNNEADFYYSDIIKPLITRTNLVNFSEITFSIDSQSPVEYVPMAILEKDTDKKPINDRFFTTFFNKLTDQIGEAEKKTKQLEEENKNTKNDKDIITQTYYSFKNINDKWLSSATNKSVNGYPFNEPNGKLIDLFAFVDRAMNPIGDTVINAEILLQMFEDPNISVFTALSQLLSLNGFEFFPLQNFMSYYGTPEDSWKDSFRINTSGEVKNSPAFVCMFIGGTSSYPTTASNGFVDDGIIDIGNTVASDFNTKPCDNPTVTDDNQTNNNSGFPFKTVRAFKVRFGVQNQTMFNDIKIDSKEYPETNESIQILSRLAGDNKMQAPVPKGQNLFNLYENRSYKATITGLGNAMIQPTQYFQLENVPLFNGAYIILAVEHTIEQNKMTTSFSGTKIARYPIPRVMNPAAVYGFEGDNSLSEMTAGEITVGAGTASNADKAKYNSMYTFNIQ